MKRNMLGLAMAALLIVPVLTLSSCNAKKLEEENANLKQQVESLTSEKSSADEQIKELTAKVEEMTKANEELKAAAAKAQTAKTPAAKKGHK